MAPSHPDGIMRGWGPFIADVLFPRDCTACETPLPIGHPSALCDACWASLRLPTDSLCLRCTTPTTPTSATCPGCLEHPPAFDSARVLGLYLAAGVQLNPLAAAVRALKYRGARPVAHCLGTALAARHPATDAIVVPVPLHHRRLRERGYNQAALLARSLGTALGLPVATRALDRLRPTPAQASLDARTRRTNLRGAFAVRPGIQLDGRSVILVDDVLTTGATADACALALRGAGARRVVVYAVGRTP